MKEVGILLPIFSLPGNYGIGDFGPLAYEWIDLLKNNNLRIWQILPLGPLGADHCPYNSLSSFGIDPIYISLELLHSEGLIEEAPKVTSQSHISYDEVRSFKEIYFKKAWANFNDKSSEEFQEFINQDWVNKYSEYCNFLEQNEWKHWTLWNLEVTDIDEIKYQAFLQYIVHKQWYRLRAYANSKHIKIFGDMPIYVSYYSFDTWHYPNYFLLNNKKPELVSGAPPDYFSADGQKWGHPLYNYEALKKNNYDYTLKRVDYLMSLYDVVRLDHFVGYDRFFAIPVDKPVKEGYFIEGPKYDLLNKIFTKYSPDRFIAEDLGTLRNETLQLRDHYNLAGMKIFEYTFDTIRCIDTDPTPINKVIYTGNHDNNTFIGWYNEKTDEEKKNIELFLKDFEGPLHHKIIRYLLKQGGRYIIFPIQDILGLDEKARVNIPGSIENNWNYKLVNFDNIDEILKAIF